MGGRIVSLILIAAIIACPVICRDGVCHCCEIAPQSLQTSPHLEKCCSCCESTAEDHQDRRPAPRKSSCQGICAGAVFEKPVSCDESGESTLLTLSDIDISTVPGLAEYRSHGVEHQTPCDGINHGRFLRTLHMSLLC